MYSSFCKESPHICLSWHAYLITQNKLFYVLWIWPKRCVVNILWLNASSHSSDSPNWFVLLQWEPTKGLYSSSCRSFLQTTHCIQEQSYSPNPLPIAGGQLVPKPGESGHTVCFARPCNPSQITDLIKCRKPPSPHPFCAKFFNTTNMHTVLAH